MELGVFIPIGNNGWLISTTSPQYRPSFDLNREVVQKAERFGFDFALSMIKLHGFGGPSQFWDYNLELFTLMAGLASVTEPHPAFRHLRGADVAAADRRPHGGDDRLDLARQVRGQYHLRLAAARIHADGDLARRRALPPALRILRRIRHHHARVVGNRPLRFQGRLLPDGRLPLSAAADREIPIICAAQSDAGTRFAAQYADYNFCTGGGVNQPKAVAPSVARLVEATAKTGRDCGALILQMVIADETDAAAMAKWEHYKSGTDLEALAWRDAQAEDDPSRDPYAQPNRRRTLGIEAADQSGRVCRLLCLGGADARRDGGGSGRARRHADL